MGFFDKLIDKAVDVIGDERLDKLADKAEAFIDKEYNKKIAKSNKETLQELNNRDSISIAVDNLNLDAETRVELNDGRTGFITSRSTTGDYYRVLVDNDKAPIQVKYDEVKISNAPAPYDIRKFTRREYDFIDMLGHKVNVGDRVISLGQCTLYKEFIVESINFTEDMNTRSLFDKVDGEYDKGPLPYIMGFNPLDKNDKEALRIDSLVKVEPSVTYFLANNYTVMLPGYMIKYKGKNYKVIQVKDNYLRCVELNRNNEMINEIEIRNGQRELEAIAYNDLMGRVVINTQTREPYVYVAKLGNGKCVVRECRTGFNKIIEDRNLVIESSSYQKYDERRKENLSKAIDQQNEIISKFINNKSNSSGNINRVELK